MKILGKRWQIDLHAQHEAHLQLSAVDLPGSVQKKKTVEDELQMRRRFKEGDLISVSLSILFVLYFVQV
jgi:exosome complex component RRP4